MIRKTFLIASAALLTFSIDGFAQDFEYSNIEVQEVSFNGGIPIRPDDGSAAYGAPHWAAAGAVQNPVAYVSGETVNVDAVLEFDCANAPDSMYVRGVGPGGLEFAGQKLELNFISGITYEVTYPAMDGSYAFSPNVAEAFQPFKIGWDVSFDNGATWKAADTSMNRLYVTHMAPMPENSVFKHWETIFDISCRGADGFATETDVIDGIWSEFTSVDVVNWEGDPLKYYSPMNTFNTTLQSLLIFKNAQCYTFAKLWLACIKIQGINKTNNYVFITPINNIVCGNVVNRFLVKNWDFGTPSASAECSAFPYKNTYTGSLIPSPFTAYDFDTEDVTDQIGLAGQNSANPSSYFNNHQISYINGKYYDACYGVTFDTFADIPIDAFDGWGYSYSAAGVQHCMFTDDMGQSALSESITTW